MKNKIKILLAVVLFALIPYAFSFPPHDIDILCDVNGSGLCCEVNSTTGQMIKCWRDVY